MTLPKADKDLLMLLASFSRSPVAPREGRREGGREVLSNRMFSSMREQSNGDTYQSLIV